MEFYEKLQELRRERGLTQEELADILFVSRTTVSKWESGRGYPNIDSLRDISKYFSVSIDDLLSGERLLSIAEKEGKSKIKSICGMIYGLSDIFCVLLIILPLYPNELDGFVYSVNLLNYESVSSLNLYILWTLLTSLVALGVVRLVTLRKGTEKASKWVSYISASVSVATVLYLALTRVVYGVVVSFILLIIKIILLFKESDK